MKVKFSPFRCNVFKCQSEFGFDCATQLVELQLQHLSFVNAAAILHPSILQFSLMKLAAATFTLFHSPFLASGSQLGRDKHNNRNNKPAFALPNANSNNGQL